MIRVMVCPSGERSYMLCLDVAKNHAVTTTSMTGEVSFLSYHFHDASIEDLEQIRESLTRAIDALPKPAPQEVQP